MTNCYIRTAIALSFLVGFIYAESCASCTSRTDPVCSSNSSYSLRQECPPDTNFGCYVRIVDVHTIRGCIADLDEDTRANCTTVAYPLCQRCYNVVGRPVCNDYVFPAERLNCFQCNGTLDSDCADKRDYDGAACSSYLKDDKCFIWRTTKRIERGCLSSRPNLCNPPENCYTCDGHGCNYYIQSDPRVPVAPGSAAIQRASLLAPIVIWTLYKIALA